MVTDRIQLSLLCPAMKHMAFWTRRQPRLQREGICGLARFVGLQSVICLLPRLDDGQTEQFVPCSQRKLHKNL